MTSKYAHQESGIEMREAIYSFPKGLPGFEQLKEFRLQEHNQLFSLLSAVDLPAITFITVNPFDFIPHYEFVLSDDTILDLEVNNREQVSVRCIVTWHSDRLQTTVNLLAPLIFNTENQKGKQIVLQNTSYTTKHSLWTEPTIGDEGGDI